MSAETPRTKLDIMSELHKLTNTMYDHREESEFLILSVDMRQDLMDEYDALDLYHRDDSPSSQADQLEMKRLVEEMIKVDATITAALNKHKIESKASLVSNTTQQKIMGYTNQALSSSGSYMDYKK